MQDKGHPSLVGRNPTGFLHPSQAWRGQGQDHHDTGGGGTRVSSSSLGQVTKTLPPREKKTTHEWDFCLHVTTMFLWKFSCMKHAGMFSSEIFRINIIRKKKRSAVVGIVGDPEMA